MGKITGFHGCEFKVGTTMISQCVAEQMAKNNPEEKILLLHLSNRESMDYMPNECGSIDELYSSLKSGIFTTSQLVNLCYRQDNLFALAGLREFFIPDDVKYMPEMAMQLLSTVRSEFNHIIMDVGNNIFWGLTIGALLKSDQNFMVICQKETYLKRYEKLCILPSKTSIQKAEMLDVTAKPPYQRLGQKERRLTFDDKVIINKYKDSGLRDKDFISQRLNLTDSHIIPYHDQSERAEIDGKSLLGYRNKGFEKAIKELANYVEGKPVSDEKGKGIKVFTSRAGAK